MRTTLDLPDPIFRKLKSRAALEGLTLKDLIGRYVTAGLAEEDAGVVCDPAATERFVSAYDLMKDHCGIVRGGPTDLSTNPKHMEGFGRD